MEPMNKRTCYYYAQLPIRLVRLRYQTRNQSTCICTIQYTYLLLSAWQVITFKLESV
jgi:hypothetical protein